MNNAQKTRKPVYKAPRFVSVSGVAEGACSPTGSSFITGKCQLGNNAGYNCQTGVTAGNNCIPGGAAAHVVCNAGSGVY